MSASQLKDEAMTAKRIANLVIAMIGPASIAVANLPPVGAAPSGNALAVATRIIQYNFPACKHVSSAARTPEGAVFATCDGVDYLVFTLFNAKEGKTIEVALNCTAAKSVNVSCYR